jgi:flavin-dependent dehydrogenase
MGKIMNKTEYTKLNIEKYNYAFRRSACMISNSSVLEKIIGQNWLAVRDASVTYDPLSSNGISSAINNSIIVADRIAKNVSTKNESFEGYDKKIKADFCSYLIRRKQWSFKKANTRQRSGTKPQQYLRKL